MRLHSHRRDRRAPSPRRSPSPSTRRRGCTPGPSHHGPQASPRRPNRPFVRCARVRVDECVVYAFARDALKEERPPTADELAAIPRERIEKL